MKIIVGGAGSVGKSIIGYLTLSDNDITVVDTNPEKLEEVSKTFDVQTVLGSVSRPDIQEQIGAKDADILISATNNDEVNLVACQVAYTLFDVGHKIARIDSEYFLSPLWNTLYNEKSLPVDLVISPDQEIAENILRILEFPGASEVYSFASQSIYVVGFVCAQECSLYRFRVAELAQNFPDIPFSLIQIVRNGTAFFPKPEEQIQRGDKIYILATKENVSKILHIFNASLKTPENIVLFGGNAISYDIARTLETKDNHVNIKIITTHKKAAQKISENLNQTEVIFGEIMSDNILQDADLSNTDISIAVTQNDKDNLILSFLAGQSGVPTTIALLNSALYEHLTDKIQNTNIIDRSSVTISKILQNIRQCSLIKAYSLGRGFSEIWHTRLKPDSLLAGQKISDISLPEKCHIIGLIRQKKLMFVEEVSTIEATDEFLILAHPLSIRRLENIFKS